MAQAQYDKFIELRKSGVDAKTARIQAYGDIPTAPTPTGGTTPLTAPQVTTTPPPPVTAPPEPQTMQGTSGETFQVAPVNPTTGLSQPTSQTTQPVQPVTQPTTPTPVTTPPATKTEAPIDYTKAQGREQDIMTNLEKFKSQNMTPDQIKTASGYNEATPEKKAIIEGFLNPVKQDSGTIFNTLRAGGSVPPSDTPEYRQAQARYNTFKKFSTYDVASLSTAMQDGSLLMGTQAYNDVISDPAMLAKVQRARAFTSGNVDMTVIGEKSGQYVMTSNPTVAKALEDGNMSQEEYDSLTNNPSVEAQAKVVAEARTKYDEYKRQLENISDTVDEEYKTDNEIFRNAVKSNLDKSIRRLFNSASDDLQNALGAYTELKNNSTALLELNMKQYEQQKAQEAQLAQEARQQQYAQEQAVFQANLGLKTKQAEFEQGLQQQAQMAKDPISGTNAIIDTFEKMGIIADRSRQEIIADVQAKVASGMPLGQALSELQTAFKSKPMYKAMVAAQMESLAPKPTTPYELKELGGKTYRFNQATGQYEIISPIVAGSGGDLRYLADQFPNQAWAKNNNPAGITWNANFDKGTGTAKLLADAGIQFAKGTPRPANEGGNYVTFATIEDGLKAQQIIMSQTYGNSTVGQMLASWVGTGEGASYAKQVAGMAGIDQNVKVSSLTPEQLSTLQMAKIKKESPGLYGILSQGTGATGTLSQLGQYMKDNQQRGPGYSEEDVKAFNEKIDRFVKNGDEKGIALAFRTNLFQDKDFKQEFDNTKKFTTALDQVQTLIDVYEKAGKSTNALKGMAEKVARSLGLTTDQALAQLQTQMGFTLANYIKSISGTAASDAEVQRLMGNMASISNVKDLNTTILNQVRNNADMSLKSMIDTRMYGMPEELKTQVFSDVYKQSSVPTKESLINTLSQIAEAIRQAKSSVTR